MSQAHRRNRGSIYVGLAATLLVACGCLLAGYFVLPSRTASAAHVGRSSASEVAVKDVQTAALEALEREVVVAIGDQSITLPWRDLGVVVDIDGLGDVASMANPADLIGSLAARGAAPLIVSRDQAAEALDKLKAQYDKAPQNARMDLERREIHQSHDGISIDVYAAFGAVELAARTGAKEFRLPTIPVPAEVTVQELGIEDISHVLATFETQYAVADAIRNFNLKLAASKLNGYVLKPGEEFSFNDIVGPRTEKEGYKVAGVIEAGEMVDGLAGGTCQISTTLHGAAFFAGLDIERALPHSRPSTYATMGIDATVVYPNVDLKLKNSFEFPVAIHFQVTRGVARVELLGKQRPYDKVVFEREIIEKIDFDTLTREDDAMPVGSMVVDQYGFYGYKLNKIRKFYRDGKMVKKDKWLIRYPPVTEYVRTGINPDPNLMPPKPDKAAAAKKRLKEPDDKTFRIEQ